MFYMALRSAGGFRPPRSLTKKEYKTKTMGTKRTGVHNNVQSDDVQLPAPGKQPRRRMHASYKYGQKKEEWSIVVWRLETKANPSRIITSCLWPYFLFSPRAADFGSFAGFENTASCGCSTTCWLSPTLSACLALPNSDRYVRASLLGAWPIALCCAPVVVHAGRQHAMFELYPRVCFFCGLSKV